MTKKIRDKGIGGVKGLTRTKNVEDAQAVGRVGQVKAATGVGKLGSVQGLGRRQDTRAISFSEREAIMKLIDEEAEKMFGSGSLSQERRAVVQQAVKIAVDSALLDHDDSKE